MAHEGNESHDDEGDKGNKATTRTMGATTMGTNEWEQA